MIYKESFKKHYPTLIMDDFTGEIDLGSGVWLIFTRDFSANTGDSSVSVTHVDSNAATQQLLATYYQGQWKSPNPLNRNLFWKFVFEHPSKIQHIVKNLTHPLEGPIPFQAEWVCLNRIFKLRVIKISRSIKRIFNQ